MLNEIIKRRSIRKYKADPVPEQYLMEILKAAQFAPSCRGQRSWQFVVVKDQEIKNQLQQLLEQDYIKLAPVIIVPVADMGVTTRPIQDIAVASENIFLQAASLGLGTVWKNVLEEKSVEVKKILKIPENFLLINIIPIGYPDEEVTPHSDSDFDKNKIHANCW